MILLPEAGRAPAACSVATRPGKTDHPKGEGRFGGRGETRGRTDGTLDGVLRELRGPHGGPHLGTRLVALVLALLLAAPLTFVVWRALRLALSTVL